VPPIHSGTKRATMGRPLQTAVLSFLGLMALGPALAALAQTVRYETKAINIEVPVRVFKRGAFVDSLTIDDFEVTDDGRPQKLEAVYLVKKTNIERREETTKFAPRTARHFFLFFEIGEVDPKIEDAIEYFVSSVLIPGDELTLVTPLKTYRMKAAIFERRSRKRVFEELVGLLRRDILIGYSESRAILEEMKALAHVLASQVTYQTNQTLPSALAADPASLTTPAPILADSAYASASFDEQLQNYAILLDRLQNLRVVGQKELLDFAHYLKMLSGQKDVFLFYQREFIPKIDPKILNMYMSLFNDRPDTVQTLTGLFELYRREVPLDVDGLKQAYSDSSTAVHFMFVSRPPVREEGIVMEEQSEDIYAPFRELARATGGFVDTSANLLVMMKAAVEASENYYLLYYRPVDYVADGKFHDISVKVKSGSYTLTHRSGYIAD
jgi:hypothetical protein